MAALKGEVAHGQSSKNYDTDWVVSLAIAILGGMAVILAVMGVALKEPVRVAGCNKPVNFAPAAPDGLHFACAPFRPPGTESLNI